MVPIPPVKRPPSAAAGQEFAVLGRRGLATREEYKAVARMSREKIRQAKAQQDLNLATVVRDD